MDGKIRFRWKPQIYFLIFPSHCIIFLRVLRKKRKEKKSVKNVLLENRKNVVNVKKKFIDPVEKSLEMEKTFPEAFGCVGLNVIEERSFPFLL